MTVGDRAGLTYVRETKGLGVTLVLLLLAACGAVSNATDTAAIGTTGGAPGAEFSWPSGLLVMGDGFPKSGDPCRRLGESAETVNYLDDSAILVGCPGAAEEPASAALVASLGAKVVGSVQNVTLVSVPQGDANFGMTPDIP